MAQPLSLSAEPLVLIIPGLNNSGPDHWQTRWERSRRDCQRVDLGMWDRPHRNTWVNKLNLAIRGGGPPRSAGGAQPGLPGGGLVGRA